MKQKSFWIGAGIGLAVIMIKLGVDTYAADMSTLQRGVSGLSELLPEGVNPVWALYMTLAIIPIVSSIACGLLVQTIERLIRLWCKRD